MKKCLLLFTALLLITGSIATAEPLTVAVYDFRGEGPAAKFGGSLTTLITADLANETNVAMVERSELSKALNEQAFGMSGLVSADAAAKIGKITGAKVLIAGSVIQTGGQKNLVVVADIIGTETGRLFAEKVEGTPDQLLDLSANLSQKIVKIIAEQTTNLVLAAQEPSEVRIDRIIKTITGTNRPSISIDITGYNRWGGKWRDSGVGHELGLILIKAGFPVMDETSDAKADLAITGSLTWDIVKEHGNLFVSSANMEVKVTDQRTGTIRALDHQQASGTGIGNTVAADAAKVEVADELAARIAPLLAK